MATNDSGRRAYIGSFTTAGGLGITTAAVDPTSGALTPLHSTDAVPNPSYLAASPDGRYLYAVSETPDGAAAAFALTPEGPRPLGPAVPVGGADPTHLTLFDGHLVTANYSSGSVSSLPVRADGSLGGPARVLTHEGSGPQTDRQEGPHAHAVLPDPAGHRLLSVDLGTDSVRVCTLGADGTPALCDEVRLRPGSGPRHLAFHPRGDRAYVINELDPTVTVCRWDAGRGALTPRGRPGSCRTQWCPRPPSRPNWSSPRTAGSPGPPTGATTASRCSPSTRPATPCAWSPPCRAAATGPAT